MGDNDWSIVVYTIKAKSPIMNCKSELLIVGMYMKTGHQTDIPQRPRPGRKQLQYCACPDGSQPGPKPRNSYIPTTGNSDLQTYLRGDL